ncbi:MAG TPA: hypothetical protein VJ397_07570 [Thermoplasmata archaeon]|nr:hypothetical protein [Thermoplasmata archaeon]
MRAGRTYVAAVAWLLVVGAGFAGLSGRAGAHSTLPWAILESPWSPSAPSIDGAMSPGEWADATVFNLTTVPGNPLPAFLLVKNNDTFLWVAYDATGDTTNDSSDSASFGVDTGHDGVTSNGEEDEFVLGGWAGTPTAHIVNSGFNWTMHDAPFDPGLPGHAGLAGGWGFGPSDAGAWDHRLYEFQVPLGLIGVAPGETIGFFGGSYPSPGVLDYTTGRYDAWPLPTLVSPPQYGDLNLGFAPGTVSVLLTPGSASADGIPGDTIPFNLTVTNLGAVSDTIDLTLASLWPASLWDSTGTSPLTDTDTDTLPDTGPLGSGASVDIIVKVDVPPAATGCSTTRVTGTSSLDGTWDSSDFSVCVRKAAFSPPHSDNGLDTSFPPNGYFDLLEVHASVDVFEAGSYYLAGGLFDANGSLLFTSAFTFVSLPIGSNVLTLQFPGTPVYNSGIDGPYLALMALYDGSFGLQDNETYLTGAYLYTEFEPPMAVFAPPHSDVGIDTSFPPNGFYDLLRVDANLSVSQAGSYSTSAALYDQSGSTFITFRGVSGFLTPGPQVLSLGFDGNTLYNSGISGPYRVELVLYDDFGGFQDNDTYYTAAYLYTEFEPPPALFNPPHSDTGVDTDIPPNGLFDELRVDAGVSVNQAGNYFLTTDLYDPLGFYVASTWNPVTLPLGPQAIPVAYSGTAIYSSGRDGPYSVEMRLYDTFYNFLDSDSYQTGPYAYTEFDPPPIVFSPPHGDAGVDTDVPPDGLFNWLRVSTSVDVSEARDYRIDGRLYGPFGFPFLGFASATATLGIGPATVDLDFSGVDTYQSGASGNFQVYLDAFPVGSNSSMDSDLYYTNYYSYDEFQPPPGLFSPPHASAGIDTSSPPDGYFDWLRVDAYVDVTKAGVFSVRGRLDGPLGLMDIASAAATLPLGRSPISLDFDGHLINQLGVDGPYWVTLDLLDATGNQLDSDWFNTSGYQASEFQPLDGTAPSSIASIAGGYWKNTATVAVDFTATDPTPADGLDTVTLYARYSADSVTWGAWTPASTEAAGGSSLLAGTFLFDATAEGYYQFYAVARDRAGNPEAPPATADAQAAVFIPAVLELTPATDTLPAGSQHTFDVRVLNAAGQPVTLEAPLVVTLLTNASGEFRAVGTSTGIATVTIPAGSSTASFDYWDTAAGDAGIAVASALAGPGTAAVTVAPGPAASLTVSPAVVAVPAGGTASFTATALDSYGNRVPSAPIAWSVVGTIGTITSGGAFTASTTVGSGTVLVSSGPLAASAPVVVTPGPLDHLEITPPAATLVVGSTLQLMAFGLDAYGNLLPGLGFAWSVTGPGTLAGSGESVVLTATGAGAITVTATSAALSASADITATSGGPGPIDHVEVSPDSATVPVGGTLDLRALGFDVAGNSVGNLSFSWALSGGGTLSATTGALVTFTPTAVGTFTATATAAGESGAATLVVVPEGPGALDRVEIVPGVAGVVAGSNLPMRALALDANGRVIPGVAVTWSVQGPGVLSATTGDAVTLTATGAGTISVTITTGAESATAFLTSVPPGGVTAGQAPGDSAAWVVAALLAGVLVGLLLEPFLRRLRERPARTGEKGAGETKKPPDRGEVGP